MKRILSMITCLIWGTVSAQEVCEYSQFNFCSDSVIVCSKKAYPKNTFVLLQKEIEKHTALITQIPAISNTVDSLDTELHSLGKTILTETAQLDKYDSLALLVNDWETFLPDSATRGIVERMREDSEILRKTLDVQLNTFTNIGNAETTLRNKLTETYTEAHNSYKELWKLLTGCDNEPRHGQEVILTQGRKPYIKYRFE